MTETQKLSSNSELRMTQKTFRFHTTGFIPTFCICLRNEWTAVRVVKSV